MTSSAKPYLARQTHASNARTPRGIFVATLCVLSLAFASTHHAHASPLDDAPLNYDAQLDADADVWTGDEPLTLEQALDLAVNYSPTLATARSETEEAILQRFAVRMERAPEFTITAAMGPGPKSINHRTDAEGRRKHDLAYLGGVALGGEGRVVVPLTTFGKIKLATELTELGIENAELEEDIARQETRYEAFRAYTGLQWYRQMKPLIEEVFERLDEAEDMLEDRLDEGDFSARNDLRELTIRRADVVKMQGELDQVGFLAEQAMRLVLGLSKDTELVDFDDSAPSKDALPSVQELLDYAIEHRPDYRRIHIARKAAEQNVRLQKRMMAPDAFFQARGAIIYTPTIRGARPGISETPDRFNDLSGEVLVGLRWKIQPGRHRATVRMAEQQRETVDQKLESAKLGLELQIHQAWQDVKQQLELVRAQDKAQRAAAAWLKQRAFQFDQGLADFEGLIDPLKAHYETLGKYHEALLRYKMHVANLNVMIGHEDLTTLPQK